MIIQLGIFPLNALNKNICCGMIGILMPLNTKNLGYYSKILPWYHRFFEKFLLIGLRKDDCILDSS